MAEMQQFRGRDASLWQSAVDEAVAKRNAGSGATAFGPGPGVVHLHRPDQTDATIQHGNDIAEMIQNNQPVPPVAAPATVAVGLVDTAKFCAAAAYRLAEAEIHAKLTGDQSGLVEAHAQLDESFTTCDPHWADVIANYVKSKLADGPDSYYRRYKTLDDFVITDRLPDQATVILIADWGTGQDAARALLTKVASHKPDVVIHLGDVYYSGTEAEVQNYFYSIWQRTLGLPLLKWGEKLTDFSTGPATFHLPGNHDMYSGGAPYYTVIDMLGQPASYFCLRNTHWQFVAMDTSLHDSNPLTVADATSVDELEIAWMKDKVSNAGGRKTMLLSHHQLFTAFEQIGGKAVNEKLLAQVEDILPDLTAWQCGHEHNLVIYKKYLNVLLRCIGHGAFPVSNLMPVSPPNSEIPLEAVSLSADPTGFYRHGYVLMKMDGPKADLSYIQFDAGADTENVLFTETL